MNNQKVSMWNTMSHNQYTNENNINNISRADLVKRSTLSVDAKEFYPANFNLAQNTSQGTTKSLQDRLNKYKNIEPQQNNKRELDYLFETIILLTNKPGKFDSTLPALVETLKPHFNDPEFITKITQEIFEQVKIYNFYPPNNNIHMTYITRNALVNKFIVKYVRFQYVILNL